MCSFAHIDVGPTFLNLWRGQQLCECRAQKFSALDVLNNFLKGCWCLSNHIPYSSYFVKALSYLQGKAHNEVVPQKIHEEDCILKAVVPF